MSETYHKAFVDYLVGLKKQENRSALAALRSGLGKKPGEATRMYPFVLSFMPKDESKSWVIESVFLTASLFASHPSHDAEIGNLGSSLRTAVRDKHGEKGVSRRLVALLDADPEDVSRHIAGLVSLCASANVPINWVTFSKDVQQLISHSPEGRDRVRLKWALHFWGSDMQTKSTNTKEDQSL